MRPDRAVLARINRRLATMAGGQVQNGQVRKTRPGSAERRERGRYYLAGNPAGTLHHIDLSKFARELGVGRAYEACRTKAEERAVAVSQQSVEKLGEDALGRGDDDEAYILLRDEAEQHALGDLEWAMDRWLYEQVGLDSALRKRLEDMIHDVVSRIGERLQNR